MEQFLLQSLSLGELAVKIDAELASNAVAHAQIIITHLSKLENAGPGSISFLANPVYKKYLANTKASAVILAPSDAEGCVVPALISKNPRLSIAKLLHLCAAAQSVANSGIHESAVIGNNVSLGDNVAIGPNCVVGDNCVIGDDSVLMANVTLYHGVTLGKRCRIHSGTVVGSDGFGYAMDGLGRWVKMPHIGGVVIGNDVEIGSNTSIDRGLIDDTTIGNGVIIDNLVQIGHNVIIGDYTAIAGCVGIAGSTHIGRYCLIGGASSIQGHIVIVDKVHLTGTSSVSNSILEPGVYSSGMPARKNELWRRSIVRFMNLDKMALRVKALEKAMNMDNVNETDNGYQI